MWCIPAYEFTMAIIVIVYDTYLDRLYFFLFDDIRFILLYWKFKACIPLQHNPLCWGLVLTREFRVGDTYARPNASQWNMVRIG